MIKIKEEITKIEKSNDKENASDLIKSMFRCKLQMHPYS
jgi:hypothetical protein